MFALYCPVYNKIYNGGRCICTRACWLLTCKEMAVVKTSAVAIVLTQ